MSKKSLRETARIIYQIGPRLAGTKPCHKSADELFQNLNEFCDETIQNLFLFTLDFFQLCT
ncbi:MAG: hypothetical protein DRO88_08800 [Promethearchaeia archaeon]|nr:MAG: hypothetical protein DRO88_08800 [Candidatus Lokiarchaeia archaeon]